jgi:hypothetical protein
LTQHTVTLLILCYHYVWWHLTSHTLWPLFCLDQWFLMFPRGILEICAVVIYHNKGDLSGPGSAVVCGIVPHQEGLFPLHPIGSHPGPPPPPRMQVERHLACAELCSVCQGALNMSLSSHTVHVGQARSQRVCVDFTKHQPPFGNHISDGDAARHSRR